MKTVRHDYNEPEPSKPSGPTMQLTPYQAVNLTSIRSRYAQMINDRKLFSIHDSPLLLYQTNNKKRQIRPEPILIHRNLVQINRTNLPPPPIRTSYQYPNLCTLLLFARLKFPLNCLELGAHMRIMAAPSILADLEVAWFCNLVAEWGRGGSEFGVCFDCVDGVGTDADGLVEHSGVAGVDFGFSEAC